MKQAKKVEMAERDMMEDSLQMQKQATDGYNLAAGECADTQLRAAFMNILTEEHKLSSEIFEIMSARGWYQAKPAADSDVSKAKQKFSESAN